MVKIENLRKRYGRFPAVDGISFTIPPGEIFGLLGPNGSGKSTTMNMMIGVTPVTSGTVELFGKPLGSDRRAIKARIGVVPETHPSGSWSWMTAGEYLEFFASLYQVERQKERTERYLEVLGLSDFRNRRFVHFSKGMLQKLSLIRALLPDPDLLILDEPTSGLDPAGVKQIRDLILTERRADRSIIMCSHQLSEVERICDRVAIISRGRLGAIDTMDRLLSSMENEVTLRVEVEDASWELVSAMRALEYVKDCLIEGASLVLTVPADRDYRKELSRFITDRGVVLYSVQQVRATLEDAFIRITEESIRSFIDREEKV